MNNNNKIFLENQYILLKSLYNLILKKIPNTHKKKKINGYYLNDEGNIKYFFYGYEFVEWILKSKSNSIPRPQALKIAQSILSLFIISVPKLCDDEYLDNKNKLISNNKLIFKDDKTCYSIIKFKNIKDFESYNCFINDMNLKFKNKLQYLQDLDSIIKTIFPNTNLKDFNINENIESNYFDYSIEMESLYDVPLKDTCTSNKFESFIQENKSENPIQKEEEIKVNVLGQNDLNNKEIELSDRNLISIDYKDEELDISNYNWSKYFPLTIFLMNVSTAGLCLQWHLISEVYGTPKVIYLVLGGIAGTFWVSSAIVIIFSFFKNFNYNKKNYIEGVNIAVINTASLSLFQIADIAIFVNRTLGKIIFWIGFPFYLFTFTMVITHLILRFIRKKPISITPSLVFLTGVFLITGSVAKHLGYNILAWVTYGYGAVLSISIHMMVLIEYIRKSFKGSFVPLELIPAQSIFIGYSALVFATLTTIQQKISILARFSYLFVIINIITVVTIWIISIVKAPKRYIPPFNMGMWGFSFPAISFGVCTTIYYKYTPALITKILSISVLIIGNLIYIILISFTIYYALKSNLFIVSKFNKSTFLSPKFNNTKSNNCSINQNNNNNKDINLNKINL